MSNNNSATPAQAATPEKDPQNSPAPATTPAPTTGDQGTSQEGKVTIDTKEYAQLQRDAARARSSQKRNEINSRKNSTTENSSGDPNVDRAIEEANNRAAIAERNALQAQVKGSVRDLLEREEFKTIPKSTKALILQNPALLSNADNLEEALLDIEDFIRDQVLPNEITPTTIEKKNDQPAGHETPPANVGAPAPAGDSRLEDVSKLSGNAKSMAMIRNSFRAKK